MSHISTKTEKATSTTQVSDRREDGGGSSHAKGHRGGHGHSHWMMIACCVPMVLVVAFLLVGGAGIASLAPAVLCVAMMGVMMLAMSRMHRRG